MLANIGAWVYVNITLYCKFIPKGKLQPFYRNISISSLSKPTSYQYSKVLSPKVCMASCHIHVSLQPSLVAKVNIVTIFNMFESFLAMPLVCTCHKSTIAVHYCVDWQCCGMEYTQQNIFAILCQNWLAKLYGSLLKTMYQLY